MSRSDSKINNEILVKLVKQGKTQVQIAKRFGVSQVSVSKRIRRLFPPKLPASFDGLTEKEKHFVLAKGKGKTSTNAALESFETKNRESAKTIGVQLMQKPEIKVALNDLLENKIPQVHRVTKLRQHVDNRDPSVSLKALDTSWRLDGSYAPEKHLNLTPDYATIVRQRWEAMRELILLMENDPVGMAILEVDPNFKEIADKVRASKAIAQGLTQGQENVVEVKEVEQQK